MKLWITALISAGCALAQQVQLTQVASGIISPTDIQNAGDGSGRLFLVQQNGIIRILQNGAVLSQPFLDISSRISTGGERGLLGLAFPPGFAQKQRFFVNYTDTAGNTVIGMYRVSANPNTADASSEVALFHVTQPYANHNGGQLRFGPDGYLYIGLGDGGSGGDPQGNAQNKNTLLGKILRVDVESTPGTVKIPADNPFVNTAGARPEVWAYGLRNPWRFSFDRANGDLYIADVGQDLYEEIDYQPAGAGAGANYGWNVMEGNHCYTQANCSTAGLTMPVIEYAHESNGCAVIGGSVYRGKLSPGLRGLYFLGDYCSGKIWVAERHDSAWTRELALTSGFNITVFGEDEAGEMYVANATAGAILQISGSRAPRLDASAVVNAASYARGLTPGSAASLFAAGVLDSPGIVQASGIPLPISLGDVVVTVNGMAAPIYALANVNGVEQVNFQVPFAVGQTTANVVLTRAGQASAAVSVALLAVQPALYSIGDGRAIVVHNADYSLVSAVRPLEAGEYAFAYVNGLGMVDNPPLDGSAASSTSLSRALADVSVTLGGVACDVQFAGLAPGFVGLYQVNFRVPAAVPSGAQDLVVSAAGVASPPLKISVK